MKLITTRNGDNEFCRYDACHGEDPLEGYSNVCYSGQAIANLCGAERMDSEWEDKVECGARDVRRKAIFKVGCVSPES